MATDRERIETVLTRLIERSAWDFWRAADMLYIDIGERVTRTDRRGEQVEVGEYRLHVQCRWRLRGPDGIITGRRDFFWPSRLSPDASPGPDWDGGADKCETRGEERLRAYLAAHSPDFPTIVAAAVDEVGDIRLHLSDGALFETFLDDSRGEEDWRLFRSGKPDEAHFVVHGGRVTRDVDWE